MRAYPFVILFYAQRSLPDYSIDMECFKQMRVHYPNAPVLFFRGHESVTPSSYIDEYTTLYPHICTTSLDVWKAFYRDTKHDSAILWPSHFFIGSLPLPPLLNSRFFWVHRDVASKPSTPSEAAETLKLTGDDSTGCPLVVDLYGYLRRSVLDDSFLELQETRSMILFVVLKGKVAHSFWHGPEHDGTASREYVDALKTCRAPVFQLLL